MHVCMYGSAAEERVFADHDTGGGGGLLLQQEQHRKAEGWGLRGGSSYGYSHTHIHTYIHRKYI